jgi:hypothetical protein
MLSASLSLVATLAIQADTASAQDSGDHAFYVSRFIAALLVATFVPLLIDRRARRSDRARP